MVVAIVKTSEKRLTSLQGPKDLFPMRSLFGGFTVIISAGEIIQVIFSVPSLGGGNFLRKM